MLFRQIEDPKLAQYAYLIGCQRTGEAVVFDPERDVAPGSGPEGAARGRELSGALRAALARLPHRLRADA